MAQSCEELVIKKIIIGGEDGPQGPQGPPGESLELPIAASDISVTNPGYANLQVLLDDLLNVPLVINSFTTPTTLFEKRLSTDPSADFTMNFTWILNQIVTGGSQTLIGPNEMTPVSLTTSERDKLVTLTDFNTNGVFTLTATTAAGDTQNAAISAVFANRVHWGDSTVPGAVDSTFILSLSNKLSTSYNGSYNTNTGASEYFWFAYPVAYGTPTLKVGVFDLDALTPVLVSHTNSLGHTENYNVIRSTYAALGGLVVDVT